jgi:sulfite oxidase
MSEVTRRSFLGHVLRAGGGALILGSLPPWPGSSEAAAPDLIERSDWPEHWETSLEALGRSWITANARFFVRSHFPAPVIDPATWKLEVTGLVERPLTLTLAEIQALPALEAVHTLECAGNGRGLYRLPNTSGTQWERGAVGTAAWGGMRLSLLLQRAGVRPEAKHVWFEAGDAAPHPSVPPFLRSIPIEKASSDVLLAHRMNGEPLPHLHGAPLRAIVPGWYGMASTKWLTRVRVEAQPSDNHFMVRGYRYVYPGEDPAAPPPVEEIRIKSLITRPLSGARVAPGQVRVQGFAWSGLAGVRTVEVSADGGLTWKPAGFMGETAPLAWRAWATEIDARPRASLAVMARATDGAGMEQPLEARINAAGYGNNSIHRVGFHVRG